MLNKKTIFFISSFLGVLLFISFVSASSDPVQLHNPVLLDGNLNLTISYNSYSPFVYFYSYSGAAIEAVDLGCAASGTTCRGSNSFSINLPSSDFPLGTYHLVFYSYSGTSGSWITKTFDVSQYSTLRPTCSDGTAAGSCSSTKALDCLASSFDQSALGLVKDCLLCCSAGESCPADGGCAGFSSSGSSPPTPSPECKATSNSIYVKGTVTTSRGSYTDRCSNSTTLEKGYCYSSNVIGVKEYNCSKGCSNGACLGAPASTSSNVSENGNGYIIEFTDPPLVVQQSFLEQQAKDNEGNFFADIFSSILPASWKITPTTASNLQAKVDSAKKSIVSQRQAVEQNISQMMGKSSSFSITGHAIANPSNVTLPLLGEYDLVYNGIALNVSSGEVNKIKNIPGVKAVYPNQEIHLLSFDPSIPQTGANRVWQEDANGNNCSTSGEPCITGQGVTIGIIDTGVDYSHPDLGNCTQAQFLSGNCKKVVGGYNFVDNNNNPMDDNGHGTQVASIAAGNGTLMGVAPGAEIYAYKVLDKYGAGLESTIIEGVDQAMDPNNLGNTSDHVDIISLSTGGAGNPDDPVSQAVDNAVNAGVVVVAAAGNSGTAQSINSPGTASEAITVGAVDSSNNLAGFSSRGPVVWTNSSGATKYMIKPDISAPGVMICGAKWDGSQNSLSKYFSDCIDSQHIYASGTSQATPYIAGVAALLLQKHPGWTPEEVKSDLISTASSANTNYALLDQKGFGVVNTSYAVNSYSVGEIPCVAQIGPGGIIGGVVNISGEAYCDNSSDFANYSLYSVNSSGQLNQISSSAVPVTNGVLSSGFFTDTLPKGEDTFVLIVTDKFGHEVKDATIFNITTTQICIPKTCSEIGAQCGSVNDGCGGTLNCGSCSVGNICNSQNQCSALKDYSGVGCGSGDFSNCPNGGYKSGLNYYCNLVSGYQGRSSKDGSSWSSWVDSSTATLCENDYTCGLSGADICVTNEHWQMRPKGTCTASGTTVADAGLCCSGQTKWITRQDPNTCSWCSNGGNWPWCWPWDWKHGTDAAHCGTHTVNDHQVCT